MSDPYERFTASVQINIVDQDNLLQITSYCDSCFIWEYKQINNNSWSTIQYENDGEISVINSMKIDDEDNSMIIITSLLIIQSIRTEKSGNCVNNEDKNNHIFLPSNNYEIRLKLNDKNNSFISNSDSLSIITNNLPSDGYCIIQNVNNLYALDKFTLFCDEWSDNNYEYEYNALISNVLISSEYVYNPANLTSLCPAGDITITVNT